MGGLLARTVDGASVATQLRVQPGFKQSLFFYQVFIGVGVDTVLVTPITNDTESASRMYINGRSESITPPAAFQSVCRFPPTSSTAFTTTLTASSTAFETLCSELDDIP